MVQQVNKITSRTVVLSGNDIDTDQIIPARFLTTTSREGLGQHLFNDLRFNNDGTEKANFALNDPQANGCKILVGGTNFGCGSSREHAPWALLDYGIRAVISSSIADIFRNNSLKNGLIPVVIDENVHRMLLDNPGIEATIELESQSITLADGTSAEFAIDSFAKHCLLNGVDQLGYLLNQNPVIVSFEENRSWTP